MTTATDNTGRRATVVPYPDGPLIIRGDFSLEGVDGDVIDHVGKAVALCRCGKSRVKPFCDGTHKLTRKPTDP
ncbi:MAG TPA: CDGSH iron-sulfur domain-containing protein [Jatrophihabitantaceae bacterium]|jgi:CDGSH-type Zn-finger protein|nr:CDGSH iron-sulfur domain-containing protein [Jatrophihabitantaceae bacterium]